MDTYLIDLEFSFGATREDIIERDKGRCFICRRPGTDVHEIIPRSHTSKKRPAWWLFDLRNRVLLCRVCHNDMQHTYPARVKLFRELRKRFRYDYSMKPFTEYLN